MQLLRFPLRLRVQTMMQINWLGYQFRDHDGYGRFGTRIVAALMRAGVQVQPAISEGVDAPPLFHKLWGLDWDHLTISCLPPTHLKAAPGRHWLYTMTEGGDLPPGWADWIKDANIERLIVPCRHNAEAFERGGVSCPIHVIPGGTDPYEFPIIVSRETNRPYTFLALADRGARKGWTEVYQAFYKAFGSHTDTPDVRLIIKSRPDSNDLLGTIAQAEPKDPRITILQSDLSDMSDFYRMGDCFAIPSRSEGWGMPHREAAMMGLPVITQAYSGMDDGYTDRWAYVVGGQQPEPIPGGFAHIAGMWRRANVDQLATALQRYYRLQDAGRAEGARSAQWLRENQTWDHTAQRLIGLIGEYS